MATTLALAMRASMSASGVTSGANEAAKSMDKMGKQAKQTASDVSVLKNLAIGAVVAKGITMAADAFASAGRAALSYASSVAQSVDAMNDLSQRVGMGVESLQSLQMAAKLSGIDNVTGAVQKLGLAIGQAAESGNTDAFTKLGLDFAKLQAMSPEEQFKAVQTAISSLPTSAERAAAAVSVFGKAGVELVPLMSQNLAEVEERMKRLGAIVGTDQVEAIGGMNDALDMTRAMFDGIVGNVVGNLAPIVESLAEQIMAMVESFEDVSGSGGEGIANAITNAMLDIADYLAGVFDTAVSGFDGFGVTMTQVAEVLSFVGNVFTAVAEVLRGAFNIFQAVGNTFALGIGKLLEGLGSWLDKSLQQFGKDMAKNAADQLAKNTKEGNQAFANAGNAASRAISGDRSRPDSPDGPARRAVQAARDRMDPQAKSERESARKAKDAEAKAAREAAAAAAKAKKDAEEVRKKQEKDAEAEKKRQEDVAKKLAGLSEKANEKKDQISEIETERSAALEGKSNESLKANDMRSAEGVAQYLALASGREDPAIAEYRKQTAKLDELKAELRALQQQQVDILGAAA